MTGNAPAGLPDFTMLPDLALRPLGGAVIWANDDLFAEKENLIKPGRPTTGPRPSGTRDRSMTDGRPGAGVTRPAIRAMTPPSCGWASRG
ncbi:putative allantoicase [Mycobacteroides abscessus 21]|uniref:Putative allantoicase n=1 Tax=Mycobacteroides abscessus 21 TaxID=1299324 RepID=A0A829Q0J2_9MYCO|nr:putative allantoicase [Mycobacteroides abscessus 21]